MGTSDDEELIGVEGVEGVDEGVPLILLTTIIMAIAFIAPTTQQYLNLKLPLHNSSTISISSFLYTTLLLLFIAHWI